MKIPFIGAAVQTQPFRFQAYLSPLVFLLVGAAACAGTPVPWQDATDGMPPLRVYTSRDTGVATMAWSAAQDSSGTLYFGCDTVVSFDGDRWHPEKMDPTYLVRGLDIGPNGRLWVAGVNQIGWFEGGPRGALEYHSLMGRMPAGTGDIGDVWRVYALGNDSALFVAREKIIRWDGKRITSWGYPGMRLLWSTRTAKSVYVHYPPLGLFRIGQDGPTLAVSAAVLGSAEVRWIDDSGEDWLLLTSQGFKRLHEGQCTPVDSEVSSFVRANAATSAVRLRDGCLAISTLRGGIAIVAPSGQIQRVFNLRSGLPANQVYSLFVDRDGALWGMGPSEIIRLGLESGTRVYGPRSGYPPGGCLSLTSSSGVIFGVSHSDMFRLSADPESGGAGQFTALGISSSRFYSLLSMPDGIAVGHFRGLGLWNTSGMRSLIPSDDIVFFVSASQSRPGSILASFFDRVVAVNPLNGQTTVVADSLPDYGASVVDDQAGRVWIGTPSRGLFVTGPGSARASAAGPRFGPVFTPGPALVAKAGPSLVLLTNGGAYFLDPKRERFRAVSGFPGGSPTGLSNPDSHGGVWATLDPEPGGHVPRLGRITFSADGAFWTPQSLEGLAGVGSLLGLTVVTAPGGDALWIAGTESLLRAGPSALAAHPAPRAPKITAWVEGDNGGSTGIRQTLPYSTLGLHVEYSSLDYGARESEKFQTLLAGAESKWTSPTNAAERDIAGLREGSYDFKVRLVTDSGALGEPATLHFDIAPPWWRTLFARAGISIASALAIFTLLRLRTRYLKRRADLLERMVRQRTAELEKANAAKTEFVANMSHEIRNPMGGILSSSLELSQTPLGPDQQRLVTTLRSCSTFLAALVEDVLDFASIEAGAYTVTRGAFCPTDLLENVITMLKPRASQARMTATVDPALPGWLMGDAARIQQVVVNFAANSLKFGGTTISLSASVEDGHVLFAVADDGIGIAAEEERNLFIRFSRLKAARNSAIPGTGLGLAVSRELAERMGGSVGFSRKQGAGSSFFLRLPLETGACNAAEPMNFEARGSRALVVEDIKYNARALGVMLARLGFNVDFAEDGAEALARLAGAEYRVVFMDCDLPRVNGLDVARRFRESETPGKRTLIIATTALSTREDQSICIEAGMDAFVSKPITPEKLEQILASSFGPAAHSPRIFAEPAETKRLDLTLLTHFTDGSAEGLEREVLNYVASLDEAMQGVHRARASGSRAALASAAHRVLSLARMVGADALAAAASDIQEYATVFTDGEVQEEVELLARHAGELGSTLACTSVGGPLNPSQAS